MTTCERCEEMVDHTQYATRGDYNSPSWCDACMATEDDVWSACGHCGADVGTTGVPSGRVYCADCVASGGAAYDVADRAGDVVAARSMCPACALLGDVSDSDCWSCGSCGSEFAHSEGVHDVQYGIYHEFTCHACLAAGN
jgi:ribosomal protein S27AE